MFHIVIALVRNNFRGILRDRVLHAVFGVALVMILLVPSLSSFSMRQVQELSITLSLSAVSLTLLVLTLLLGSSSIWRDIDRRYTSTTLTLPVSRPVFLLGKFASILCAQVLSVVLLGAGCAVVIVLATASYPSEIPVNWGNIILALCGILGKFMLLAALSLLLSSVSTSFSLPFFGTLVIYLCGSASQEVYEYVTGEFGRSLDPLAAATIKAVYFLLPNFSAFDFHVHAVYALPVKIDGLLLTVGYGLVYVAILLVLAVTCFERRELP